MCPQRSTNEVLASTLLELVAAEIQQQRNIFVKLPAIYEKISGDNVIDVDDILSESFMPGSLLMLETPENAGFANITSANSKFKKKPLTGTIDEAISTMGFHRSKINEYLCRSFLAEEIVAEMSSPIIRKRLGLAEESSGSVTKENMIQDEGSRNYQNWLTKSTTLEDIYKHYETDVSKRSDGQSDDKDDEDEEYDPQVTRYTYQQQSKPSHPTYGIYSSDIHQNHQNNYGYLGHGLNGYVGLQNGHNLYTGIYDNFQNHYGSGQNGHNLYTGIYDNFQNHYGSGHRGLSNYPVYTSNEGIYGHDQSTKSHNSGDKEKELTDLLEIASTALAFLSFGMFIIHVIMCVSSISNNSTTIVTMMPMSMSPSGSDSPL
ncbi:hypothetical protein QE152_g844 [Popillia japonica]|uniref:Uncharacterized protein n=1 Tax=Popillia japonica TaxID=7064 RepID=A0AAW1N4G8_POPJA